MRKALEGKNLIAAGEIATLDDIRWLRDTGFDGAVLSRALYEGQLNLAEALTIGRDSPASTASNDAPAHAEEASQD